MKMLTAYTMEIDDLSLAVSEIMEQLDCDNQLMKHSAGLINCYSEFVDSGVVEAIMEALPFEVIGATTLSNGNSAANDLMMLNLCVFTGDDVEFAVGYSESLGGEQETPLSALYQNTKAKLSKEPVMMLNCSPLLYHVGGDETAAMLDKVSNGLLNFGTLAIDHLIDYSTSRTFATGHEATKDRMAILMIAGNIKPRFIMAQLPMKNVDKQRSLITAAKGNILMEVDDMPVMEYMKSLGLSDDGNVDAINSVPYIVDFRDGTPPLVRAIFAGTPEGYVICGGVMPEGAMLSVGSLDYADVMSTTEAAMERVVDLKPDNGVLIFSCIARHFALGMDTSAEIDLIGRMVPEGVPYYLAYAGGELCPVYDVENNLHNRFHNNTLVMMIF